MVTCFGNFRNRLIALQYILQNQTLLFLLKKGMIKRMIEKRNRFYHPYTQIIDLHSERMD